jgi:hypothetical protein
LFPKASYLLLEDPDVLARARSDPRALLDQIRLPVIIDEIQNVPELLPYIRTRIDETPRGALSQTMLFRTMGQWLFTGSQEAPLMKGVTESMAGRAAILQLLPFSLAETDRVSLLHVAVIPRCWDVRPAALFGSVRTCRRISSGMCAR